MNFLKMCRDSFAELCGVSVKLIKHGSQFAAGICLIGITILAVNHRMYIINYAGEQYGANIVMAGVSLLVQFIIGGIVLDVLLKRAKGR